MSRPPALPSAQKALCADTTCSIRYDRTWNNRFTSFFPANLASGDGLDFVRGKIAKLMINPNCNPIVTAIAGAVSRPPLSGRSPVQEVAQ